MPSEQRKDYNLLGVSYGVASALSFTIMAVLVQRVDSIPITQTSFFRGMIAVILLIWPSRHYISDLLDFKNSKYVWFRSLAGA